MPIRSLLLDIYLFHDLTKCYFGISRYCARGAERRRKRTRGRGATTEKKQKYDFFNYFETQMM